jgi:hypothetical protein
MHVVLALYEFFVGAALLLLPWSRLWQANWFFWRLEGLQGWILGGGVRGAVSGLGAALLISALMTFMEIGVHERDATGLARGQVTGDPRDARPIGG